MESKIVTPLRYPGGKAKALKKILPLIPVDFKEYREPLVGGGSVFLRTKQTINPDARYKINDINYDLFCFWNQLKNNSENLINDILDIKQKTKDGYALYRYLKNKSDNTVLLERAIRFYILNRITFSGTIDSGGYSKESFEKRFTLTKIMDLFKVSKYLIDVEITNLSYEKIVNKPGKNVFIYLDPPYYTATRLYGKNGDLTINFDHIKFYEVVKNCNHKWLISYDDSNVIRKLYKSKDYFKYKWKMRYAMSNSKKGNKVKNGKELFISNYEIDKKLISKLFSHEFEYLLTPVMAKK